MKSILIAYEDQYHQKLHVLVKRLRRDSGLPGVILEGRSVRGTGGFINEVPTLLRMPFKQTQAPPDRLVCLADIDRPGNLVPGTQDAPSSDDLAALGRWVREFEVSWHGHLSTELHLSDADQDRLKVVCLRWNKESLLTAAPDAILDHALEHQCHEAVRAHLDACVPSPLTLEDGGFLLQYRSPQQCMDAILRLITDRSYKKGRDDEDLLDRISQGDAHRQALLRRCPDLARLLDLLQ